MMSISNEYKIRANVKLEFNIRSNSDRVEDLQENIYDFLDNNMQWIDYWLDDWDCDLIEYDGYKEEAERKLCHL